MEGQVWARFFSEGFFGYGEKGDFKYWSLAHFIPLILLAVGIFLLFHYREKLRNWKHEEKFRYIIAVVMIVCEMSYYWRLMYVGPGNPYEHSMLDKFQIQVCGWTCILASIMMFTKSKLVYPMCFFVCFTLGIFPLLTPAVISTTGPGYYRYYQYWLEHTIPPLSVFYMTFVHGFRPKMKGIINATCFMSVLVTLALVFNFTLPELVASTEPGYTPNYLYLAVGTSEGGGSVMDILIKIAPNVWGRLVLLIVVVEGLFFGAYYAQKGIAKLYDLVQSKKQVPEQPQEAVQE